MTGWLKLLLKILGIFFSLIIVAAVAAYITLLIVIPSEKVEVPQVVGKSLEEAAMLLSQSGLGMKVAGKKFSSDVPVNVVISQTPLPGTKVKKNRMVEVVISGGAKLIKLPLLAGMKLREAKLLLSEKGIPIAHISWVYSDSAQEEIISQDPPAGSEVIREEGVNLLVSAGPESLKFMMPDFRGEKIKKVSRFLQNIPLSIAKIKEVPSSEEEGTVISQSPPPGSMVDENTGIELEVSTGPEENLIAVPKQRWMLSQVSIPLGFDKKKVWIVITDEEGERTLDYGIHSPGEKIWISYDVFGKGEVQIYIGDKLVKLEKLNND